MNRVKFGETPFLGQYRAKPARERVETLRRVPKTFRVMAKIKSGLQRRKRRLWQHRVVRKSVIRKSVRVQVPPFRPMVARKPSNSVEKTCSGITEVIVAI